MIKGDKIKLIKPMGAFTNIGEVCEVVNITEDGVISFKFGGCHLGCMSYDECDKYFEKIEYQYKDRKWSNWVSDSFTFPKLSGGFTITNCHYRTNGKKVQVFAYIGDKKIKTESICHNDDIFDFDKGLLLAKGRLMYKFIQLQLETLILQMLEV